MWRAPSTQGHKDLLGLWVGREILALHPGGVEEPGRGGGAHCCRGRLNGFPEAIAACIRRPGAALYRHGTQLTALRSVGSIRKPPSHEICERSTRLRASKRQKLHSRRSAQNGIRARRSQPPAASSPGQPDPVSSTHPSQSTPVSRVGREALHSRGLQLCRAIIRHCPSILRLSGATPSSPGSAAAAACCSHAALSCASCRSPCLRC